MKIGFICLDWSGNYHPDTGHRIPGGCGYYRMVLPAEALAAHGVEAVLGTRVHFDTRRGVFSTIDHDGNDIDDLDVVIFQRWMDKIGPKAIELARSNGQTIINDVDDYFDGLHPNNNAFTLTSASHDPKRNRVHYRHIIAASDGVITSTPFLRDRMRALNPRVAIVRNAIDLTQWPQRDPAGAPVLGWIGAPAYRSNDLKEIQRPVSTFMARHPEVNFFHGGHMAGQLDVLEYLNVYGDRGDAGKMCSIYGDYQQLFASFNIGLVPLNDVSFNHAKSAIKGMEYAASGLPFVASSAPEYDWLRRVHGIGAVAEKPKAWGRLLGGLLDPDERTRIGAQNRERVAALDISERWRDWLNAILEIAG